MTSKFAHTARRRLTLAVGSVAMLASSAVVLSGCGSSGDSTGDNGPVTLKVLESTSNPADQQGWRDFFDKFEQDNPGIKVDLSFVPIDKYPGIIRTRLLGGDVPDVFHITVGRDSGYGVWDLAPTDVVMPLDDDSAAVANTPATTKPLTEWDGHQYAWGNDLSGVFTYYNKDLYEAAGVEVPQTFDDVLNVCRAFQDMLGKPAFALGGALPNGMFQIPLALAATTVTAEDAEWNDKRDAGEVNFASSEGWREQAEQYLAMNEANCFQEDPVGTPFPDAISLFTNEEAGSMVVISVVQKSLQANPDVNIGAYVLPGTNDATQTRAGIQSTKGLAISAKTAHPDEAKKLIDWAAQPDNNAFYGSTVGGIPIIDASNGDLPDGLDLLVPYVTDPAKSVILTIEYWPAEVASVLAADAQAMFLGKTTIDASLSNLDRAFDAGK